MDILERVYQRTMKGLEHVRQGWASWDWSAQSRAQERKQPGWTYQQSYKLINSIPCGKGMFFWVSEINQSTTPWEASRKYLSIIPKELRSALSKRGGDQQPSWGASINTDKEQKKQKTMMQSEICGAIRNLWCNQEPVAVTETRCRAAHLSTASPAEGAAWVDVLCSVLRNGWIVKSRLWVTATNSLGAGGWKSRIDTCSPISGVCSRMRGLISQILLTEGDWDD